MLHDASILLTGMHTDRTTTVAAGRGGNFYVVSPVEAGKRPKQLYFRTTGTAGICSFQVVMQEISGVETVLMSASVTYTRVNTAYTIVNDVPLVLHAALLFDVTSVDSSYPPTGLAFNFLIG